MGKSVIDYTQSTDREILMNLVPRVDNLEEHEDEQDERSTRIESSIVSLKQDLADTEERLTKSNTEQFNKIEAHLTRQDERMDRAIDKKRKWSDGEIIVITAVCTFIVYEFVGWLSHIWHW